MIRCLVIAVHVFFTSDNHTDVLGLITGANVLFPDVRS